jgi:hypothetical protein
MVHAPLDHLGQGKSFVLSSDDEDDLARVHDGLDADGECHAGHRGEVVVEKTAVVEDGLVGESLDAGAGGEGGAGLRVEGRGSADRSKAVSARSGCWGNRRPTHPLVSENLRDFRGEACTHLVERNVPIRADPAEEQLDPANSTDRSLVILAFLVQVLGLAIENVRVLGTRQSSQLATGIVWMNNDSRQRKSLTYSMSMSEKRFLNMKVW